MKDRLPVHVLILIGAAALLTSRSSAQDAGKFGFSRIFQGWTNYSTAFNATHDPGPDGEYATVACFYTPAVDVRPLEFSAVVIWFGAGGQRPDFRNFTFQIHFWTSLDAFINNPRQGNLVSIAYASPTGGSTTIPDTVTRGGRPAYLVRFSLTNTPLVLAQCETVLIGLSAHADANQAGELYVPTAAYEGRSDAQGGNIVSFGWRYLIDAGGLTAYWGQLATELSVQPVSGLPSLGIERTASEVRLTWPASAGCFALEGREDLGHSSPWSLVEDLPLLGNSVMQLDLQATNAQRWFRLRQERPSIFRP
jgi:hypothetical protein